MYLNLQRFVREAKENPNVVDSIQLMVSALRAGNKVLFCGNGGSAGMAQHLAAELMGRFNKDRRPLASLSLTVDTSAITAIGNDYGFDQIFSRQLEGLGKEGDVLVAMSTSGKSVNVIKAIRLAEHMGIKTIALAGRLGMADYKPDIWFNIEEDETAKIQQLHLAIGHVICEEVERAIFG